jgi:hypothetical protein
MVFTFRPLLLGENRAPGLFVPGNFFVWSRVTLFATFDTKVRRGGERRGDFVKNLIFTNSSRSLINSRLAKSFSAERIILHTKSFLTRTQMQ